MLWIIVFYWFNQDGVQQRQEIGFAYYTYQECQAALDPSMTLPARGDEYFVCEGRNVDPPANPQGEPK